MNSVLDGFCIDINIIGFPKEAPLLVVEDQYIKSTRAKSVRVFIRDKQGNGTQIIDEVKKLLMEKYMQLHKVLLQLGPIMQRLDIFMKEQQLKMRFLIN